MRIPQAFSAALEAAFAGRLRARWSPAEQAVLIEQRGPAPKRVRPPRPFASDYLRHLDRLRYADDAVRARDGFLRLMAIAPGDRMKCTKPGCPGEMVLPPFKTTTPKCPSCGLVHRPVGFWPLSESLLEHLRWSDPGRGGLERVFRAVEAGEEAREKADARAIRNHGEAALKEDFSTIFQIPQVGYTGKEFRG